ncbi:hypothetical protein O6072_18455 [Mycolicibacterium neoaurum]|uniref:hypothetical protein n=1 Tax=Mycolicibacterium neoaurum TaxID=1795 RepID=UPI00248BB184|nr:hypothetical protein [Mycolicibacterium neoaurum]WBP93196.1 hypothetical protein O7W24_18790 [Mycolicibacterium neoaurum]WBS06837.1 hypothetical protein O6072_18455 [Mycolicibacterium neoaurum]
MDEVERDRLLTELIAQPTQRQHILRRAGLNARELSEIEELVATADLLWLSAKGAPPLADDPAAAVLGLVPDEACSLDSKALALARRRSGLTASGLAQRLRARGWELQTGDVFRWETRSAIDVPPAVIQAVADVLNESVDRLVAPRGRVANHDVLVSIRRHPMFEQLVERWAQVQHVSSSVAAAALETRVMATVHRGERPDAEQLMRSLEALVRTVEQSSGD